MAQIKLENLTKRYGSLVVVDSVNLDIADDEFLVLVGPSGCGKTTTLRMVAGLEDISDGSVFIGDKRVNDVEPKDRDIAMVFQSYALYPHMSVFDNMAFGLKMRKVETSEITRRIEEASAMLGIGKLLKRKPRELSGGQRQRVALGRAIVREPAVFLMDEPLSNLDAQVRANTRTELLRIHQRVKNTVIYVTHDQVEAMTMGDRIVVMKDGIVQQVASPKEIYNHPANKFVASFIGSPPMNFFDADLEVREGVASLTGPSFNFSVNGNVAQKLLESTSRTVTLGVRPEDVLLDGGNATGAMRMRIDVVETLGAEQHLFLSSERNSLLARVPSDFPAEIGDQLNASIDPRKLHVFNTESGQAYV
ncbi:MAG: sn-glycerol-3-phosphate ABC transporter ATP-binding protein UgpC [Candidatus Eremiobacteraeota bacterium]|nr:sn-glycerol-3-phosphate ABC transporter ATP-binding protein UgpC [Candidatus Eremiobacteraeota bacterium]